MIGTQIHRSPRPGTWLERHAALVFVAPALMAMVILIGFPLLYTIYMSLHRFSLASATPPIFTGLQNFAQALGSATFRAAVGRTFGYTSLAVLFPTLIGLGAALVFAQKFRLRGMVRTIYILPMMATPVAMALIWQMMFHPTLGVLNYFLTVLGLPPSLWIFSSSSVIPSLVLVETWQTAPFMMLIILGGLSTLPAEVFEAATVDGASPVQKFRYLTLPLVWPYIVVAMLLRTIDALKSFDHIYVMTQGGPGSASETLNIQLYLQAFTYYEIGYASAIVLLFMVIILLVSLVLIRFRRPAW